MRRVLADAAWWAGEFRRGVCVEFDGPVIRRVQSIAPPGNGRWLLPTFANAHVHLELSALAGETLPHPGFADWVEQLVQVRRQWDPTDLRASIDMGVQALLETGTSVVGDIDSTGASLLQLRESPLQGVVFQEVLGISGPERWQQIGELLRASSSSTDLRAGISPHAPYSTGEDVYARCVSVAREFSIPLASHIAETREEQEFLEHQQGPLQALFDRWSVSRPPWSDPQTAGLSVLLEAKLTPAPLLVHGNYLHPPTFREIARTGAAVVYCPRSHGYFDHPTPHPATRMLEAGVTVALGTDSRASNVGLDMWGEMSAWRCVDAQVSPERILECAIDGGRQALGLPPAQLVAGQPATFQVAAMQRRISPERWLEAAVDDGWKTKATVVGGQVVAGYLEE